MPHNTTDDDEAVAQLKYEQEMGDGDNDAMEVEYTSPSHSAKRNEAVVKMEPKDAKEELERMFDDDDDADDIDFLNSNVKDKDLLKSHLALDTEYASPSDPQVMLLFYTHLFPWRQLFRWLNHSERPSTDFSNREFAFTLQSNVYLRYQSFPTFETLRKEVLKLNPTRFEIGPVYSANPRDRKTIRPGGFKPLEKELVFDIDLTDYDEIRTCCSKTAICTKCWQFITMAIKVMDAALRDDFGFQHILWVYSGRRGAHAWVCDKKARKMDDARRRAIATYMQVIKGGSQSGKKVNVDRPLHPHIQRSYDILKSDFRENILENQNPFKTSAQADRLLRLLPDRELNDALKRKWDSQFDRPSVDKWRDIDEKAAAGESKTVVPKTLKEYKQDIILEYTYPRLDAEVSKHLNHLLKSPFVVHPGTGKVCVPIDPAKVETFNTNNVPTVSQLMREIDQWKVGEDGKDIPDIDKTSLKQYHDFFSNFVKALLEDEKITIVKKEDGMDF